MEKAEFERQVVRARERFSRRGNEGLIDADWRTRREVIRPLVERVEIVESDVGVVYKVKPYLLLATPRGAFFKIACDTPQSHDIGGKGCRLREKRKSGLFRPGAMLASPEPEKRSSEGGPMCHGKGP
jgi:hypothetical protein